MFEKDSKDECYIDTTVIPYTFFDSNYDYTIYTDVATDYEALSKNPVYYEFVDLGKALNKLRYIEHHQQPIKNVDKETSYIGKTIFVVGEHEVYPVLVKTIDIKLNLTSGFRADITGLNMQGMPTVGCGSLCFDNFKEALDALGLPF